MTQIVTLWYLMYSLCYIEDFIVLFGVDLVSQNGTFRLKNTNQGYQEKNQVPFRSQ